MKLIFLLCFLSIQIFACGQMPSNTKSEKVISQIKNIYRFPDTVKTLINTGIERIFKQSYLDSVRNEDLYILLSDINDDIYLRINYCKKCAHKRIIKSSDRFYKLNSGYLVPIIFNYDLEYSDFLYDEKGYKTNIGVGGYHIIFTSKGQIKRTGFEQ